MLYTGMLLSINAHRWLIGAGVLFQQCVRVATQYAPPRPLYARCAPLPVHSLHALRLRRPARLAPWIFMMDRQRLALGGNVETGVVHINYVETWTANQSGLVTLTFDLLTLKVLSESRATWATSVPILVFLGLSVLDLGPMYATDWQTYVRQTDVRRQTASSLNAPA